MRAELAGFLERRAVPLYSIEPNFLCWSTRLLEDEKASGVRCVRLERTLGQRHYGLQVALLEQTLLYVEVCVGVTEEYAVGENYPGASPRAQAAQRVGEEEQVLVALLDAQRPLGVAPLT